MWGKLFRHFKHHWGTYSIVAMLIGGLAFYVIGSSVKFHLEALNAEKGADEIKTVLPLWTTLLIGIGGAVLAGGVSGGVLKLLAMQGFFREAVAEVVYGERGVEMLGAKKLEDLWLSLTRKLYLKNMGGDQTAPGTKVMIENMRGKLESALQQVIPSQQKHFVQRSTRKLEISWEDEAASKIRIDDESTSMHVLFNKESISWKTEVLAESGQDLQPDAVIEKKRPVIVGNPDVTITSESSKTDNGKIETKWTVSPCEKCEIRRERLWKINILNDPNFHGITQIIVNNYEVLIHNRAKGLRVVVKSVGGRDLINVRNGANPCDADSILLFEGKKLMLAEQGFMLTFIRVDA